jgi:hypothetical protein
VASISISEEAGAGLPRVALPSVLPSLWLAWLAVTMGDLVTFLFGDTHNLPYVLFNLFTPILIGTIFGKPPTLSITVPLLFLGLLVGDLLGKQIKWKSLRFTYNLVVLFVLTSAIDLINWGSPKSIEQFLSAVGRKL